MLALLLATLLAHAEPTWPGLDLPGGAGPASPDAAVVVGIDDYLLVEDVPGAADNAADWYRWLTGTRGIPAARVQLLRNSEAYKEAIEQALARAAGEVGPGGRLWFVFVGHGAPAADGRDGVLVGADAQAAAASLYARSLPRARVLELVGGVEAVLVLDTCFSGRSARGGLVPGLQPLVPVSMRTTTATVPTATVLTAAAADQFAGPLPGAGRPAFSYLVLGGLLGWADADRDGTVTAGEAVAYARDTLAATLRDRTQTPALEGPDRALGAGTAVGPDVAALVLARAPARPALDAHIAALRDAQQARIEAEARARAALDTAAREDLERRTAALLAEAATSWASLQPLLDAGGPEATQGATAYVDAWAGAQVDGRRIGVPQVDLARAYLAGGTSTAAVTAPPAPAMTGWPFALFEDWVAWRRGLDADPAAAWQPYLAVYHLDGGYAADAAAYAEGWLQGEADRRKDYGYALVGLVGEAQDAWIGATPTPLILDEPFADFGRDVILTPADVDRPEQALRELARRVEACPKLAERLDPLLDRAATARAEGHRLLAQVPPDAPGGTNLWPDEDPAAAAVATELRAVVKAGASLAKKAPTCR